MPYRLLFEQQDAAYKTAVLGTTRARVAVEAAGRAWLGALHRPRRPLRRHACGASGKIADVYKKFDINAEAVYGPLMRCWLRLLLFDVEDPDVLVATPADFSGAEISAKLADRASIGCRVVDAYLKHRETALQFHRTVFCP
jgi:hypothetical protein